MNKLRATGIALIVLLITAVLFTGCPNTAGSGAGGGGTVPPAPGTYAQVPYGELEDYLRDTASSEAVNYIEVTGTIPLEDFTGTYPNPGTLGKKLKSYPDKKVALKIATYPAGLTDMFCCFIGCTSLTTAPAIPQGVTSMLRCFSGCTSLTTVPDIPVGVTDMVGCFEGCTSLTIAPAIPASVTDIKDCFSGCTSLTTVPAIPASVKRMGSCFKDCTKLTGVTLKCNYKDGFFNDAFQGCTALQNGGIKVPNAYYNAYTADTALTAMKVPGDTVEEKKAKFAKIP